MFRSGSSRAIRLLSTVFMAMLSSTALLAVEPDVASAATNGQIVYQQLRFDSTFSFSDIWTINPDGTGATNITNTVETDETSPVWSPDGSLIAFGRFDPFVGQSIVLMEASGGNPRTLFTASQLGKGIDDPTWAPDGQRLAFECTEGVPPIADLCSLNVDGTVPPGQTDAVLADINLPTVDDPEWSPDGTSILFGAPKPECPVTPDSVPSDIWLIQADGSGLTNLTTPAPGCPSPGFFSPTWSPDSSQIAYHSGGTGIIIANADGSDAAPISGTDHCGGYFQPDWSPDGLNFAFSGCDPVTHEWGVGVMNVDGSGSNILLDLAGPDGHRPDWQCVGSDCGQAPDAPPTGSLALSANCDSVRLAVTADASSFTDTDATPIASYTFDFGDGTVVGPQADPMATHTFEIPGTFTVVVRVADTAGLVGTASASVTNNCAGPARQLQVALAGSGIGTVTSDPVGISCPSTCAAEFGDGTVVTLTQLASPGSAFAGWSGEGCTGTGDCQLQMSQDRFVTATFDLIPSGRNHPPTAIDDILSVSVGGSASVNVLSNDFDEDGDSFTVSDFTQPKQGTVTCSVTGLCTYIAGLVTSQRDSFTYTITDARGETDRAKVGVTFGLCPCQPDLMLRRENDLAFLGDNVYQPDLQQLFLTAGPNAQVIVVVRVQNDGAVPDTLRLELSANLRQPPFSAGINFPVIRLFDQGTDVTKSVRNGKYTTPLLEPGEFIELRAEIATPSVLTGENRSAAWNLTSYSVGREAAKHAVISDEVRILLN